MRQSTLRPPMRGHTLVMLGLVILGLTIEAFVYQHFQKPCDARGGVLVRGYYPWSFACVPSASSR